VAAADVVVCTAVVVVVVVAAAGAAAAALACRSGCDDVVERNFCQNHVGHYLSAETSDTNRITNSIEQDPHRVQNLTSDVAVFLSEHLVSLHATLQPGASVHSERDCEH
jgi:thymidine kinase